MHCETLSFCQWSISSGGNRDWSRSWSVEQQAVIDLFDAAMRRSDANLDARLADAPRRLLHVSGEPGAGKSEVTLHCAWKCLNSEGKVLIACPTGALVTTLREKMPDNDKIVIETVHSAFKVARGEDLAHYNPPSRLRQIDLIIFDEISQIEEGAEISPYKITLSLSGLDPDISGAALTEDYYLQPVTVYLGVLDADDALLADPTVVFEGAMDQMTVSVGAEGGDVISLTAESELARFNKASNLKYTSAQLQDDFAGDLGFDLMADIDGAKLRWGDPNASAMIGTPRPGTFVPFDPDNISPPDLRF